ncbi:MAG: hypothetical protein A2268_08020 [Candidatus Raymondbacteria bacterium RifOxyA12_full_50_37]|uniref:Uncharacterized protein n=1 Tax=Candidatus Raymondbacteria bacterium RIFOXYD12_FULL_49_13 TaxID=1817890 RepID=A0A1F7FJL9_UNCRA|nr:MAG: hypothetical protein A2268_08020 [Candidatus Raymondbacteria bacterium RifOxyA12_full_50_37]OGJ93514.1 MAG: hypothetical protein A2248_09065 [Candidatus Raymondbacteria bacterium RIFOXYA2_FULL_49_16]OGJ96980.1 MAG: hypothetical protein A2487_05995 [Candidatus Raymondbacteria bacterium RifOxyC12_full_50_8]OGJ98784.1 MAG: hypothetical protein A2453_09875 [Candidatus Raymondbacteria bacterium RIFOXYC2_FULL_50_21]OGK06924.1 MAG: hypothetical protein A2519_05760 [Candidatus Raymondbacteria b
MSVHLFLFMACAAAFSAESSPVTSDSVWTVSGLVVERENGLPPSDSGLLITLGEQGVKPDSEGAFTFTVRKAGTYTIKIKSHLFVAEEKTVSLVPEKTNLFVSVSLERRVAPSKASGERVAPEVSRTGGLWHILGFVVEDRTELPLPDARLFYDGRTVPLTEKASFQIVDSVSGEHHFNAEHPGCRSLAQTLFLKKEEPDPFIVLRVSDTGRTPVKREIVVSAAREPLHVTARPGSVPISRKEIERSAGVMNDPVRVLQTLPGVSATSDLNSRPVVRGGDVLETRVALDGIPLLQPYHFGGFKSIFNASAMEKMTLHRDEMPAQFHNALSAITAVEARNPMTEKGFDLAFDVNLLQYNAFLNVPILPEKIGVNLATQGSYMDWMMKRMMDLMMDSPEEADYYKASMSLPDYLDFSLGIGLKLSGKSRLFVNGLYNTDRYYLMDPESVITYQVHFSDGTDTTMEDVVPAFDRYYNWGGYDPYFSRQDSEGNWMYSEYARRTKSEFQPDTVMFYRHAYSVLYGLFEHQYGAENVFRTSLAWQRRGWNIRFFDNLIGMNGINGIQTVRQQYDVTLDQGNFSQSWIYSGRRNHLFHSGLQADYTRQDYHVHLPRYLHEMIIRGSTNYGDMWGPVTGDSGYAPFSIDTAFLGAEQYGSFNDLETRTQLNYEGHDAYVNGAVFASDRFDASPKLTLNLGFRGEVSMIDTSFVFSPRVSAHYSITSRDEWHAGLGHYTQNNYDFSHVALSERLRPEKAWHASVGWTHEFLPWLKQELTLYHKQYYHLVTEEIRKKPLTGLSDEEVVLAYLLDQQYFWPDSLEEQYRQETLSLLQALRQANPDEFNKMLTLAQLNTGEYYSTFTNNGTGFAQGIEYFLRYDPADFWSGWISMSLARSLRSRESGWKAHPFPLDRSLLLSMVNYYRLPRAYEIALRVRYMTGLPYTDVLLRENEFRIGPYNEERYAAYVRFDFRISKSFRLAGHKCHWYTELWNAFNTPNAFLRDRDSGSIKMIEMNFPVPVLFMGLDFAW